jgi:segregation and condensation protein B
MARKPNGEPDFDRELADLPPELRWREWKARVEAVLFAVAKPVGHEILARVVGRDCALDLLLDDLREDLRGRPIELKRAGGSFTLHTRRALGPALRVAFDIPADAKQLPKLEAGVLMAVGYFQPVTRGELSETFGREISRDLIAALRAEGLIAAGPRSPTPGARYACVTTEKFLLEFGFESLRDLPTSRRSRTQDYCPPTVRTTRKAGEMATGSMRPDRTDAIRPGRCRLRRRYFETGDVVLRDRRQGAS